ncbi:hypothetical protein BZG02_01005 [Labilibaculum filiforme]|uniref:Uncharacterized protein n=2 Tax=Labilibaculum filiforme TaxID=1940526 RepID=A0A2N3I5L6_9BACT|nr:hypothetical protein BZG02_01005 [Labilibaculum filiforme]
MVSSLHPLYTSKDRVHLDELDGVWVSEEKDRFEIKTIIDSTGLKAMKNKNYQEGMSKEDAFFFGKTNKESNSKKEEDFFAGKEKKEDSNVANREKIENFFFNPVLRKHYQIKIISGKEEACLFEGRLFKLDEHYFLDVIPNDDFLEKKLNNFNLIGLVVPMHAFFKLKIKDHQLVVNGIENDVFEKLIKEKKIRIEYIKRGNRIILTSKTEDIQKFLVKFSDAKMFNDPKEAIVLKRVKN